MNLKQIYRENKQVILLSALAGIILFWVLTSDLPTTEQSTFAFVFAAFQSVLKNPSLLALIGIGILTLILTNPKILIGLFLVLVSLFFIFTGNGLLGLVILFFSFLVMLSKSQGR